VLVDLGLKIAVAPAVIAEGGGVSERLFRSAGDKASKFSVVFERGPANWIVAMAKPQEPPKPMSA
jgi:hypothetical protein